MASEPRWQAAALGEASKETASISSTESALPAVAPGQAGKAVASASRAQPTPPAVAPSKANETVAPAGPPERGSTATSAAPKAPPRLRLVINSFVAYGKPLGLLLESLQKAKFHHHFRDIVVSVSGSTADVGPHDAPGRWGELGVTIINTTFMSFDFAGLSTIFHHLDHPRVRAHAYLYVHDTVFADAAFTSSFEKLASIIREDEVRAPGGPNSNMFAFGHKVVRNYTTNFDHNLTKWDGVLAEFGYTVKGMKNIKKFATKVTNLPQRVPRGTGDPYHTGVLRKKYWYPDFALYKFILDGKYGDITSGRAGLKPNR